MKNPFNKNRFQPNVTDNAEAFRQIKIMSSIETGLYPWGDLKYIQIYMMFMLKFESDIKRDIKNRYSKYVHNYSQIEIKKNMYRWCILKYYIINKCNTIYSEINFNLKK